MVDGMHFPLLICHKLNDLLLHKGFPPCVKVVSPFNELEPSRLGIAIFYIDFRRNRRALLVPGAMQQQDRSLKAFSSRIEIVGWVVFGERPADLKPSEFKDVLMRIH